MPKTAPDLIVREHERHACDVPVVLTLGEASAASVRLAKSVTGPGGVLEGRIVDFSRGGLGLSLHIYLPPSCALVLTIPGMSGEGPVAARVRRVTMVDRKPTYYLGLSFESRDAAGLAAAERIMRALKAPDGAVPPEASLD